MTKTVAIIGAMDTKGSDYAFIQSEIEQRGYRTLIINTGVLGEPTLEPDIPASQVANAGGSNLEELRKQRDKSKAMNVMTKGIAVIMKKLFEKGQIHAGFSMGGTNGTIIGSAGLRELPIGIPKVMVSTVAAGDTLPYVGFSDVVMFPSILDVSGLNRVSAQIYANAVGALVGMLQTGVPEIPSRPIITASMFGNTTTLVNRCKNKLEEKGFEIMVFHATGTGGKTMESLIEKGFIRGVLDVTPTELADYLVGGVLSAGPTRLDSAAKIGIPQVIAPGCLDMVNFWGINTVPDRFKNRQLYEWNSNVTLMRTTPDENQRLGSLLAKKLNQAAGPVAVFLPLKGISELDSPDGLFWNPNANDALFQTIKDKIRNNIPVYEIDCNINDEEFSNRITEKLLEFIEEEMRD
ncbi:Tm-1-like ATP-binding domain-containing protein [Shimazuella sp. AN120528]|uniref:Tm-1-like ATP-binding domain-containing protein n=1 Tax=Shimazuella soli TaxID=1892854 RepID=UPI001F111A2E|nr:Tm-1-like ATP-binding domain-containing protein [Shimazuella soli]